MRSSGAHTISLHNIRYEMQPDGGKLWVYEGGREVVIASVYRTRDGERWQAWYRGTLAGAFETEELARQVLEAVWKVEKAGGS